MESTDNTIIWQFPTRLIDDPRIGRSARHSVTGFAGEIIAVFQWEDSRGIDIFVDNGQETHCYSPDNLIIE